MSAGRRSSTWACGERRPTSRNRSAATWTTPGRPWRLKPSDAAVCWLPRSGGAPAGPTCPTSHTTSCTDQTRRNLSRSGMAMGWARWGLHFTTARQPSPESCTNPLLSQFTHKLCTFNGLCRGVRLELRLRSAGPSRGSGLRPGTVNLIGSGRDKAHEGRSHEGLCPSGHAGDLGPGLKGLGPGGSVLGGGAVIAAEMEEIVDPVMGGEEALGLARRLEPLHLPFASPRRLMGILRSVVEMLWGGGDGMARSPPEATAGAPHATAE